MWSHGQTHYYIVKNGVNTLYIGTFASAEPTVGELRFIARLSKSALPNGAPQSEVSISMGHACSWSLKDSIAR